RRPAAHAGGEGRRGRGRARDRRRGHAPGRRGRLPPRRRPRPVPARRPRRVGDGPHDGRAGRHDRPRRVRDAAAATTELTVGAVAYDPKVVTIWEGFRDWFRARGTPITYVLYADYERQVTDLLAGRIDVAWNSPLAWVRARRLAEAAGRRALATVMRD